MAEFLELLNYGFVIRALIAGALISICASVIGVILVLKHYSLIGHGLSEIGFASLSIAAALNLPYMLVSIPLMILSAFGILFVSQKFKSSGDNAIAIASTGALALGILINSLNNTGANIFSYLFGSVLAMSENDFWVSIILSILILAVYIIFYNRIFLTTYNSEYARSLGINSTFYDALISILTAFIVVAGMRITGTLLISGIIILPAMTAKNFSGGFLRITIIAGIISFLTFTAGIFLSLAFNTPAGAGIILVNIILMALIFIFKHHDR